MVKQNVTAFLMALTHSHKAEVGRLRERIFDRRDQLVARFAVR